jgi:biotin transport system substrate-specific component
MKKLPANAKEMEWALPSVALRCLIGATVLALFSQIAVPWIPVPFTLQTLGVSLIALVLGPSEGLLCILLYLLEGACGMPVFAHFSRGLWEIAGPTGGYLVGFLPMVYLTGVLLSRLKTKSSVHFFVAGLVGTLPLYLCGYLHLAAFVGFSEAYRLGIQPFWMTGFLKGLLFSVLASHWNQWKFSR